MFQSNSFAAAIALCFSGFATFCGAAESMQVDVFKGGEEQARGAFSKLRAQTSDSTNSNAKVKIVLVPVESTDERVFFFWSDVHPTIPMSEHDVVVAELGKPMASIGLQTTAFSPDGWQKVRPNDVVELRTYIATEGNLDRLHARFRDHTMKLFEKHGMRNLAYFELYRDDDTGVGNLLRMFAPVGQETSAVEGNVDAAPVALVYLLAHASKDAAANSFQSFRSDEDWIKARQDSESNAGGSLTVGNGVKSLFLKPIALID